LTLQSLSKSFTLASVLLAAIATIRWHQRAFAVAVRDTSAAVSRAPERLGPKDTASIDEAANSIVDNDPFRLTNSPPLVRFDLAADGATPTVAALRPPRPVLTLKAIVGGPPWQAVIDGIPGEPAGTVAEQGRRFDKLLVRAVTRDSVVVQGPDTSWVLNFRKGS
jgi:hypothetical protein